MYHELGRDDRSPRRSDPGYLRYVLPEGLFRDHMTSLTAHGFEGVSVGKALESPEVSSTVCITTDDGHETDYALAAPILKDHGFGATFYLTAGWIGKSGFLSVSQARQLQAEGFEIGCHSMTHAYLSTLDQGALRAEVQDGKALLEDMLGVGIHHFSCPGGRWSRDVARAVQEAGFRTCATSEVGVNNARSDPFRLARVAITASVSPARVAQIARGEGLAFARAKEYALGVAKRLLGNSRYERLRSVLLSAWSDR